MTKNPYCDCCATVPGHIMTHYDPDGLTKAFQSPEAVLEIFRGCFGDECDLTLADVESYLDELKDGKAAKARKVKV